jgi:hypothetical protein
MHDPTLKGSYKALVDNMQVQDFFKTFLSLASRGLFFFFLTKRSKSQGLQKKKLKIFHRV